MAVRFAPIREAPRVEQPGVDDLALVPASCWKIQNAARASWSSRKNFNESRPVHLTGIDGLRLDPLIPLPDDQALRFFLLHSTNEGYRNLSLSETQSD